jgi:hypothetical protein
MDRFETDPAGNSGWERRMAINAVESRLSEEQQM